MESLFVEDLVESILTFEINLTSLGKAKGIALSSTKEKGGKSKLPWLG